MGPAPVHRVLHADATTRILSLLGEGDAFHLHTIVQRTGFDLHAVHSALKLLWEQKRVARVESHWFATGLASCGFCDEPIPGKTLSVAVPAGDGFHAVMALCGPCGMWWNRRPQRLRATYVDEDPSSRALFFDLVGERQAPHARVEKAGPHDRTVILRLEDGSTMEVTGSHAEVASFLSGLRERGVPIEWPPRARSG